MEARAKQLLRLGQDTAQTPLTPDGRLASCQLRAPLVVETSTPPPAPEKFRLPLPPFVDNVLAQMNTPLRRRCKVGRGKVAGVPLAEQRIQGGVISSFYQEFGLGQGDPFQVVVDWGDFQR